MKPGPEGGRSQNPRRAAVDAIGIILDGASGDEGWEKAPPGLGHPLGQLGGTLEARDYSLAMELCQGVVRRRLTLDTIINGLLKKPLDTLPVKVRNAIRVGAYQILYLDRVPDHAAVNESVRIARRAGGDVFGGLTNGVLRNMIRKRDGGETLVPPVANESDSLALEHSYPLWLVRRWWDRFGREETEALLAAGNRNPGLTLRVVGAASRDELIRGFHETLGIEARPCVWAARGISLPPGTPISSIPASFWGRVQVQDEASQLVAELVETGPGQRVLDACAAPGGKTAILSEAVGFSGQVVAVENDARRCGFLRENVARLGLDNVRVVQADLGDLEGEPGNFDHVLVDAPCTGLGVLRKHPEIKWRREPVDLGRNGNRAGRLLAQAARLLRPGGSLVYAVCSTEPEEGEDVARRFEEETGDVRGVAVGPPFGTIDGYFRSWPHRHGTDGFFAARWKRNP